MPYDSDGNWIPDNSSDEQRFSGGGAAAGATAGAVGGATIGTAILPGIGTAVGGAVGAAGGALVGGFAPAFRTPGLDWESHAENSQMGNRHSDYYGGIGANFQGRQGPGAMSAANIENNFERVGADVNTKMNQKSFADILRQRATGQDDTSVAQKQLLAGRDDNIAAARAMAASQDGASPAMAMRSAQQQAGQANMDANRQAALLRAQEQQAASGQYQQQMATIGAQGLQQRQQDISQRGQDIGISTTNAQLSQDAARQNLAATMTQRQMNDEMTQFFMNQGLTRDQAELEARNQQASLELQAAMSQQEAETTNRGAMLGLIGGALGGAGNLVSNWRSDINLKKNITNESKEIRAFLDSLKTYGWEYKNKEDGVGKKYGVMAQDLEKSKVGKTMVEDTPGGKSVSVVKSFGPILASLVELHKKQSEIDKKLKGLK